MTAAIEADLRRAASLAFLDEESRTQFLQAMESPALQVNQNPFIESIARQFKGFGHLSEKQVTAFLNAWRRVGWRVERMAKVAALAPVVKDEYVTFAGKVIGIDEGIAGSFGPTTRFVFQSVDGTTYTVKTTAKKLAEPFRAAKEDGATLRIEGQVVWVSDDKVRIALNSRKVKILTD